MSELPQLTLGDLCVITDCEHKTAPTEEIGIPLIRTPNIGRGRLILDGVQRISDQTYRAWTRRGEPRSGDLIMAREAPVGNVALIPPGQTVCLGQRTVLIRVKDKQLDQAYLNYLLNSDAMHAYLNLLSTGATVGHLNVTDIRRLRLPALPSRGVQRKIAAILSAYDELIENNKRRVALLEKMAEEIYCEWFVRLRFPGHEMVKFTKGMPDGWTPTPSNQVYDVLSGGTPDTDNGVYWDGEIPFFTPRDATEAFYVLKTEKTITEAGLENCNSQLYPIDTIFITARGTVGKLALAHRPMAMNQSCYALRPKGGGNVYFYFLAIRNAIDYIKGVSKSGVFDNIIIDTFKIVPIFLPPAELISKFNDVAAPIFNQIRALAEANELLVKCRDRLLPRLISGKLSVESLDIQFPLSMSEEALVPTLSHGERKLKRYA